MGSNTHFRVVLIKPSHYDDDGYVIQWLRSAIPSNTLAQLYALAIDSAERQALGDDVEITVSAYDETNTRIKPKAIIREIRKAGGRGMVGMVGVQSNQFPHTMDLARPLHEAGIPVCIGGFHVSGCLAMLPETPPDIQEAIDLGISIFAGEAEDGRLDQIIQDAYRGELKPVYNYMNDLPGLDGAVAPMLPASSIKRYAGWHTTFDSGRGCPYQCSFCTIINVQGRKSRYRRPDDVEQIVRANAANGVTRFLLTDDNFARNKIWEEILDRFIKLREEEGIEVKFFVQVDALCHKIPRFIEKCARAGVNRVYIGLENINPANLLAAKKHQNKITEYRKMLQAWKDARVMTYCGYILGFPHDTPETIERDIEILKNELPVDLMEFFCLTPLPGSADHKALYEKGEWMEPDMNKYDLEHVCAKHPKMSREVWAATYRRAWDIYYTDEHVERILRRCAASRISVGKMLFLILWFIGNKRIENTHPVEGGYFRRKYRKDRRPSLGLESPFVFYPRYAWEIVSHHIRFLALAWRLGRYHRQIKNDPNARDYMDLALTPVTEEEMDELDMFTVSDSARESVAHARKLQSIKEKFQHESVGA